LNRIERPLLRIANSHFRLIPDAQFLLPISYYLWWMSWQTRWIHRPVSTVHGHRHVPARFHTSSGSQSL